MDKKCLTRIIVIFAVLTITGVVMLSAAVSSDLPAVRTVLPLIGAAIFSSALTFFLVEIFRLNAGK